jgi:hypothetical protein
MNNMPEPSEKRLLFRVTNGHSSDCGSPPNIDGDTPHRRYSYFQNEHGEQAIFEYNMETKTGTLWMGDAGWDEPQTVIGGRVPELVLTPSEALWLSACWYAATGEVPKHVKQK